MNARRLPPTTVAIALMLLSSIGFTETAATAKPATVQQPSIVAARFTRPRPPSKGAPGNAGRGAASRSCVLLPKELSTDTTPSVLARLNALVPEYDREKAIDVWGLSASEHPTFWFYVPYINDGVNDTVDSIEFTLQNDQEETLQKVSVPVPTKAGIVGVKLSPTEPGLAVGKLYNWFFKVRGKCEGNPIVYVEGWVERTGVDAATSDRLKQATPSERAKLLAEKGIWYDALTALAEQRLAAPKDAAIAAEWTTLLKDVDMEQLANQPLVQSK